ncbi:hypothetical protein [Klebsiella quasipneumoniae]|uniref:hypothetical protein n=1 Tax=Klebsiella quasipneumoniae TaxID=1463165 RepID=UPI0035103065
MKERGMIFNSEMVRAILSNRKTQTRRIMKVQPESNQLGLLLITDSTKHNDIGKYHWAESNATGNHVRSKLFSCPFGAVGDRIWVRETFNSFWVTDEEIEEIQEDISKAADLCDYKADYPDSSQPAEGWTPSIHMPRWASRILLEITDVRVERLNAISQADAIAEGAPPSHPSIDCVSQEYGFPDFSRSWFGQTWQHIYGEESWDANPWVWVIEFERVEGGAA